MSTKGRNGQENHNFTATEPAWDIPLVVLIDGDSASASEIFAGAILDHNRGTIVGLTSYGKGSVQGVFHNENGNGGLRLTVSKFFSPKGTPISARGVQPHIIVEEEPVASVATDVVAFKPDPESKRFVSTTKVEKKDLAKRKAIEVALEKVSFGR